ncbi:MAG: heparinase II/III domain-containing protein, partial [Candidatus Latescibacterota bacterium]
MPSMSRMTLAVIPFLALGLACGNSAGRFSPSDHSVKVSFTRKAGKETSSYRYQSFDRDAIKKRMDSDPRYTEALERTRKSMAEFISLSDGHIRGLIPPANAKRALMVHRKGCPVHGGGTGVYQPFGQRVDLSHPLQVQCPIGKEWYPNKDFPDDGSGWLDNRPNSPTKGERYYFVGWYGHWFLYSVANYLKPLATVWFLTGEEVYRQKALVLLERFMEVYPDLDGNDLTYDGTDWGNYVKMTGSFWEGSVLLGIAKSVELLSPSLDAELLRRVEKSIYRPAYEAYRARPASGNWGNVWDPPLAKFAAVLGDSEMLDFMLYNHPAAEAPVLDNQFFRDGMPFEASLSYASMYHGVATNIAEAMGPDGRWVWDNPHVRASFHSFADLVCLDKFTHFAADMGGIVNNGWTLPAAGIAEAWQAYKTPELARYLLRAYGSAASPTPSLDDLFKPGLDLKEVQQKAAQAPEERSTLAPVRGIAVLRSGKGDDRAALVLDYGYAHAAHHHADRLNINFFAAGREFIPEMGYPEYMDHIAPATGGWTTHTVCHATVEVNGKRQATGISGDLHAFEDLDGIKFIDASCEEAYAWCGVDRYRRTLLLIETPGGSYVVDLFRVRGGKRRDYLFHGPIGDLTLDCPPLSGPQKGTLAGENIPFGQAPEGVEPYDVRNSGYQYLYDARDCRVDAPFSALWTLPDSVKFRASFVPEDAETFIRAEGYPRPSTKSLPPMPFLLRRLESPDGAGESRLATVLSVERDEPFIKGVRRIELSGERDASGYALLVQHRWGEDLIVSTTSADARVKSADGAIELCGLLGVASTREGKPVKLTLVGGTEFRAAAETISLAQPYFSASIREVSDDRLILERPFPAGMEGRMLLADRGPARSTYRVVKSDGKRVDVSPSTWIGRGRVKEIDGQAGILKDNRNIYPLGSTTRLSDDGL